MIIYDLRCSREHTFEGWFDSRDEFEREKAKRRLSCPLCGDDAIQILPSGGHPSGGEGSRGKPTAVPFGQAIGQYLERNFENVGGRFADEATRMHFGEIDHRNIRGTMTPSEEQDLKEEGVQYVKVPVMKYDG